MQDAAMAMTQDPDISGMNFVQLSALRERIEERMREMRETEGPPCASASSNRRRRSA